MRCKDNKRWKIQLADEGEREREYFCVKCEWKKALWRQCGAWWRQQNTEYPRNECRLSVRNMDSFITKQLSHLLLLLLSVLVKFLPNLRSTVCCMQNRNSLSVIRCYVGKMVWLCLCIEYWCGSVQSHMYKARMDFFLMNKECVGVQRDDERTEKQRDVASERKFHSINWLSRQALHVTLSVAFQLFTSNVLNRRKKNIDRKTTTTTTVSNK